jgi:hypothetical protein
MTACFTREKESRQEWVTYSIDATIEQQHLLLQHQYIMMVMEIEGIKRVKEKRSREKIVLSRDIIMFM